jgi:hypothetical protein
MRAKFENAPGEFGFARCAAISLVTYCLMRETRHLSVIDMEARLQPSRNS